MINNNVLIFRKRWKVEQNPFLMRADCFFSQNPRPTSSFLPKSSTMESLTRKKKNMTDEEAQELLSELLD